MFNFLENVNFSSSYKGLSAHQIWFNLGQGKQRYGGGRNLPPPQVENVLNRPGEIGLNRAIADPGSTLVCLIVKGNLSVNLQLLYHILRTLLLI